MDKVICGFRQLKIDKSLNLGSNLPQDVHNLHTGCLVIKGEPIFCHSPAEFGATFSTGVIMVFRGPQTMGLQT